MINHYLPPHGGPVFWMNESSGILRAAVRAYFSLRLDQTPITQAQIDLVAAYCAYWIDAPCWRDANDDGTLERLRKEAKGLKTAEDISVWLDDAWEIGIDPF